MPEHSGLSRRRPTVISTGSWMHYPREAGRRLPLPRRSLFDRRAAERRARVPLRCVPRGDGRPVVSVGGAQKGPRRRGRGGPDLEARQRLRVRSESRPLSHVRDDSVLGCAWPRDGVVRSCDARRRIRARGRRTYLGSRARSGECPLRGSSELQRGPAGVLDRSLESLTANETAVEAAPRPYGAETGRPSSVAMGWSAATTFAMCSSSSSPRSSAPA